MKTIHHKDKVILKINQLYNKALNFLVLELNKANNQNLSHREWEICIGHWLYSYTSIFLRTYYLSKKVNSKFNKKLLIPKNSASDFTNVVSTIEWQKNFKNQIENIKKNKNINKTKIYIYENKISKSFYKIFLYKLHDIYCTLFKIYFLTKKTFIFNTYLGKLNDVFLQLKFKELPIIFFPNLTYSCDINKKLRFKYLNNKQGKENKLTNTFLKTLLLNVPINYLEGFNIINNYLEKSFLPKKLKLIFNSNEIIVDDLFKIWVTKQKNNCKLMLSQHGLNYQVLSAHFPQIGTKELSYIDKIFFWGKKMKKNKKFINMFMIPKRKLFVNKKKNLILVLGQSGPNIYHIDSKEYFLKLFKINKFINILNYKIKKFLLIRLHKTNFPPLTTKKIIALINSNKSKDKIIIDDGRQNIKKLILNSKLIIFTYPSSGFFEAISQNIPAILFWKNMKYECLSSAKNDFKILKKKNIIFEDEKKLSEFINTNWNVIDNWWNNKERRRVITNFTLKYCTFENKQLFKVYSKIKSFTKT